MRVSPGIAAAVEQPERRPTFALSLGDGLDLSGVQVDKISVTESSTAGLPSEVTLLSGLSSTMAKVTLSDRDPEDPTLVGPLDLFHFASKHPDRIPTAEQLKMTATLELGFDGATVGQVPGGRVRSIAPTEAGGSVELELADAALSMRDPVDLPAAGIMVGATRKLTGLPVNTSGVAAHVFNATGHRVTPPPRANCVFSLPGVGGYVPEVGWLAANLWGGAPLPDESVARWQPGKFGPTSAVLLPPEQANTSYIGWAAPRPTVGYGSVVQSEAWVDTSSGVFPGVPTPGAAAFSYTIVRPGIYPGPPAERTESNVTVTVSVDGTGVVTISVLAFEDSGTWYSLATVATTPGWHHLDLVLYLVGPSATASEFRVDGVVTPLSWKQQVFGGTGGGSNLTQPHRILDGGTAIRFDIASACVVPCQGLLLHVGPRSQLTHQADPADWVPGATVEQGRLDIGSLPLVQQRPGWDVLGDLAAAELGFVGFDDDGRPRFAPQGELSPYSVPVRTLSTDVATERAGQLAIDAIRNVVTASVEERFLTAHAEVSSGVPLTAPVTWIQPFSPQDDPTEDERVQFRPQTLSVIEFELSAPVMPLGGNVNVYPGGFVGTTTPSFGSFMVMCLDLAGNTAATNDQCLQVTAWLEPVSSTVLRLSVWNGNAVSLFAVWSQQLGNVQLSDDITLTRGNPAVVIYGLMSAAVDDAAPLVLRAVDRTSQRLYDTTQTLDLAASSFWTWAPSVQHLVDLVVARTSRPRVVLNDVTVPGDPRVQTDDVVLLVDPSGRWRDLRAQITRIDRTHTADGLRDTYGLLLLLDDENG